jgi:acetyl-CoA synthase
MTLLDRIFAGNDAMFEQTVATIDQAVAKYGPDQAVALPNTAYNLPIYYGMTGHKINTLGEMKAAIPEIQAMMG